MWMLTGCNVLAAQSKNQPPYDSLYAHFQQVTSPDALNDLKALQLLEHHLKKNEDSCRLAQVNSWKSNRYDLLGQLDSALHCVQLGLKQFSPKCDSQILMSLYANLTGIYLSLELNDEVISTANLGLAAWNPSWPSNKSKDALFTNKAIAQIYLGDTDAGLETFKILLGDARAANNLTNQMNACNNIAALFGMMYQSTLNPAYLDSASTYISTAVSVSKILGVHDDLCLPYMNLASIANDKKDYNKALFFLDSAKIYMREGQNLAFASTISLTSSIAFEGKGDLKNALLELRKHLALKDSLMNTEKLKVVSEMQEKYESEKKERQIKELEVAGLNAILREEKLTQTRNIYLFGALGILLLAVGLWSRLQYTRRAKAIIQTERDRSEELLLNILPEETARELKEKGSAEARLIDQVTVLFTDFKGFTAMSEQLSPKELVKDLHECFSEFDRICEKYGIEKIKTIGDAYMAAGGLPTTNQTHAHDVLLASLEMAAFVEAGKKQKIALNLPYFEIRIGVHTGPVVAGIVGIKKFQYDIWGDTVNTASRMESSGAVGKVNISQATYALLKDDPELQFESRGKIEVKGKGEVEQWFAQLKTDRP
ncbi:MAG: adenylate/guanylate cyclase domain-containing protein [Bacteroidia bacterium]